MLQSIDLHFEPGALVGLVGPPASGKSALLKLIAGLIEPKSGELTIESDSLGMVFQNNALFDSLTIFDNVAFPLRRAKNKPSDEEIERRVRERLKDVGLAGTEELLPHALSGGMQKRAGIARATVAAPRIRLYDEPTAGLDPVTASRILALIVDLHQRDPNGVSLIVSNELDTLVKAVPRVVMLYRGAIAYDGPASAIDQHSPAREFVRGDVSFAV